MTTLETLKAARKLITDPAKWTQEAYARYQPGKNGRVAYGDIQGAVCWCSAGAICKVLGYSEGGPERIDRPTARDTWHALQIVTGKRDFAFFNDTHPHHEVLRAFDEAIAKLEAA